MPADCAPTRANSVAAGLVILLLLALAFGFLLGRSYERHFLTVASPAKRELWRAREGSAELRLWHAQRAIALDPEYLPAYNWKARAAVENGGGRREAERVLDEGLDRSGAYEALRLREQLRRTAAGPAPAPGEAGARPSPTK